MLRMDSPRAVFAFLGRNSYGRWVTRCARKPESTLHLDHSLAQCMHEFRALLTYRPATTVTSGGLPCGTT